MNEHDSHAPKDSKPDIVEESFPSVEPFQQEALAHCAKLLREQLSLSELEFLRNALSNESEQSEQAVDIVSRAIACVRSITGPCSPQQLTLILQAPGTKVMSSNVQIHNSTLNDTVLAQNSKVFSNVALRNSALKEVADLQKTSSDPKVLDALQKLEQELKKDRPAPPVLLQLWELLSGFLPGSSVVTKTLSSLFSNSTSKSKQS